MRSRDWSSHQPFKRSSIQIPYAWGVAHEKGSRISLETPDVLSANFTQRWGVQACESSRNWSSFLLLHSVQASPFVAWDQHSCTHPSRALRFSINIGAKSACRSRYFTAVRSKADPTHYSEVSWSTCKVIMFESNTLIIAIVYAHFWDAECNSLLLW